MGGNCCAARGNSADRKKQPKAHQQQKSIRKKENSGTDHDKVDKANIKSRKKSGDERIFAGAMRGAGVFSDEEEGDSDSDGEDEEDYHRIQTRNNPNEMLEELQLLWSRKQTVREFLLFV